MSYAKSTYSRYALSQFEIGVHFWLGLSWGGAGYAGNAGDAGGVSAMGRWSGPYATLNIFSLLLSFLFTIMELIRYHSFTIDPV